MEFHALEMKEELEEPFSERPDIEITIILGEGPRENLGELYNEAEETSPEGIENKNMKEQEELNKIWSQIGPRIP